MRIVIGTRTSFRNDYLPFVNEFLPLGYLLLANVSVISETIELDIVLGVFRWFEIFECCPKAKRLRCTDDCRKAVLSKRPDLVDDLYSFVPANEKLAIAVR